MGRKKRHHYLPRGYQRRFVGGDRIRLVAKDGTLDRVVGTRDAFVRSDMNTIVSGNERNSELEEQWARLESDAIPAIDRIVAGDRSPVAVLEVKVLMAMQFARSRWHQESFRRIAVDVVVPRFRREMERRVDVRQRFRRERGHRPRPGELALMIDELMAEHLRTREQHVLGMARHYAWCLEKFDEYQLQVAHTFGGPAEFITSDTPLIAAGGTIGGRVRVGRAIGDASVLAMPLTRHHYALLSASPVPDPAFLPASDINWFNRTMWDNAQQYVGAHPDADLGWLGSRSQRSSNVG
jgi:hypothetical protein